MSNVRASREAASPRRRRKVEPWASRKTCQRSRMSEKCFQHIRILRSVVLRALICSQETNTVKDIKVATQEYQDAGKRNQDRESRVEALSLSTESHLEASRESSWLRVQDTSAEPRQGGDGSSQPIAVCAKCSGRVPPDLRFRGPLEAKCPVRGRNIDPPGGWGRVFDFKCRYYGRDRSAL